METNEKIVKLSEMIGSSEKIVFFGGAGVSTESGIPDFRSKDGLYNRHDVNFEGYAPEYLLSRDCLEREPEVFFEYYRQKLDGRGCRPNKAHLYLAELEKEGKLRAVVTQNIDGLHQKAGSRNVFEIHGSTERNYCSRCGRRFPPDAIFDSKERVPRCSCGGVIRPEVTLYGESLDSDAVQGAVRAISGADLLIIGGTSLTVYPAASYIGYFRGSHIAVINRDPIPLGLDPGRDVEINESIGETFASVRELLQT